MPTTPQDHRPKAAKPEPEAPVDKTIRVTWEDRDYSIDPYVTDDVIFMELLADMEEKPYLISKVIQHLLGDDQWAEWKTNHKDENGRILSERVGQFFELVNERVRLGNSATSSAS